MQHGPVVQEHESVSRQALVSKQTLLRLIIMMLRYPGIGFHESTGIVENLFLKDNTSQNSLIFISLI